MKNCAIICQINTPPKTQTKDFRFKIDSPVPEQEVSGGLPIKGWIVHRLHKITRITVESAPNVIIGEAPVNIHRPGVSKAFHDYRNSENSGFIADMDTPPLGSYSIVAHSDTGQRIPICELHIREYVKSKLLFMHIAKAGGSSVNKFLASHYSKNKVATHIESNERWFKDPDYAQSFNFVSGHVSLERFSNFLKLDDYYMITVVREPYSHVISHLAWVRKLSDPGEEIRLKQHPEYVRLFSQKLLQTDLSKSTEIKQLIGSLSDQERQLVDNCQVRYFTRIKPGEDIIKEHVRLAIKATKRFDRIGTTGALSRFFKDISQDMGWQEQKTTISENVSDNYYGMARFDTDICDSLHPLVEHDIILYESLINQQAVHERSL